MKKTKKFLFTALIFLMTIFSVFSFSSCGFLLGLFADTGLEYLKNQCYENYFEEEYIFLVKNADGTSVISGYVQLCIVENDVVGSCLSPAKIENGKCVYNKDMNGNKIAIDKPGVYEVHVFDESFQSVELKEVYRTSADKFGEYTIILK